MVDFGKPEVLKRKVPQLLNGLIDPDFTIAHLFKKRLYLTKIQIPP